MNTNILIMSYSTTGRCMLSGKTAPCVVVEFQDGSLKGPISLKALEKLLQARADDNNQAAPPHAEPKEQE